MDKLTFMLLVGAASAHWGHHDHHHHHHKTGDFHHQHGLGMLDLYKGANETFEEHSEHAPIHSFFERLFGWDIHPEDHKGQEEHHGCPIMRMLGNFWPRHQKKAEGHDTPLYESPDDIPFDASGTPTAVFHGLGDACIFPGDIQIDHLIAKGTNAYVKCIEVGLPSLGEYLANFEHVAEKSCTKVAADKNFAGEFNVLGLSQGGLLARYIAEECDMPGKVRNVVTAGGPHMGVDAVPKCFSGFICNIVNWVAKKFVYMDVVQDVLAPAGYFRDVNNMDTYLKKSVFLPALNNEHKAEHNLNVTSAYGDLASSYSENVFKFMNDLVGASAKYDEEKAALRKQRFSDINGGMFIKFSEDTVIYPKETAWFQQLDKNGDLLPLNATDFYNNDYIGLKSLNEAGKAKFITFKGDHLQFTEDDVKNTIIPFLNQ